MEVPEFDFFRRIEHLEEITEGGLSAKDTSMLSMLSFEIALMALSLHAPQFARKYKDEFLGKLKKWGFDKSWLGALEEDLLDLCNSIERIEEMK